MSDTSSPTPEIDPSGLFSTYKSQPEWESENTTVDIWMPTPPIHEDIQPTKRWKKTLSPTDIPDYETSFQKTMYFFQLSINGGIRGMKVFCGFLLWLGALFIVSLATNTANQVVDIINHNIASKFGTNITLSGEVGVEKNKDTPTIPVEWIASNVLQTNTVQNENTSATSEAIVAKRRAILEARKAAKILQEQQKASQNI